MSMTKEELMNVFREAASAEFSEFSPYESDYTYEFSERFEKRMDRLIRAESRATWRFVHTKPTRLILIAVAVIATLFLVACTVPEVRESIAGFFIRMFSDHAEITLPIATKSTIDEKYELYPLPEGFEEMIKSNGNGRLVVEYRNKDNDVIKLEQTADGDFSIFADEKLGEHVEYTIDSKTVFLMRSDNFINALWEEDGYIFRLYSSTDIDFNTVESWIKSVRPNG